MKGEAMPIAEELPCGCCVLSGQTKKIEYCTRHLLYDLCAELAILRDKYPSSQKNPLLEELMRRGFDRSAHLR